MTKHSVMERRTTFTGKGSRSFPLLLVAVLAGGCSPMVDVLGVYFPPWLASAITGIVVAYVTVWLLGRRPETRVLAQSGLLFCSLTLIVALLLWWLLFSGF